MWPKYSEIWKNRHFLIDWSRQTKQNVQQDPVTLFYSEDTAVIRTIVLSLAAVLMLSSTSQASFVFSFAQPSVDVQIGGSESVDVVATNTGLLADFLNSFTITINQTTADPNITPAAPFVTGPAGPLAAVASGDSIVVGSFTFLAAPGARTGDFAIYEDAGGSTYSSTLMGLNATSIDGLLTVTAVPEPTSLVMFGSVIGLGLLRRRR